MRGNFDTLTGLRGILALWVAFYHLIPQFMHTAPLWVIELAGLGYLAVDFFFVLSGFVIAMTYQKQLALYPSKQNLCSFYIKRIARIYPLHIAVMLLYLAIPIAYFVTGRELPAGGHYDVTNYFMSLLLINNWGFSQVLSWNVPSWSISAEFASYLAFPIVAIYLHRVRSRLFSLLAIVICSGSIAYLDSQKGATNIGAFIPDLGVWRCLFEFLLGVVVFSLFREGFFEQYTKKFLLLTMLFLLLIGLGLDVPNYSWIPLFMMIFVCFFISLELDTNVKVPRFFIWLGNISYSVYLIHYITKDIMKLFLETEQASWEWLSVYFVIVLGGSHCLYHYYELPAKRWLTAKLIPLVTKKEDQKQKRELSN